MARRRLTAETLDTVSHLAEAREHVRLAESILGPAATDKEVLATAQRLASLPASHVREINRRRAVINQTTRKVAGFDGAEDPWDESGPEQPDPTNNQAYTKQIMITPDHAVQESLQKRDVHTPTAAKKLSTQARRKWAREEVAPKEDLVDEDDREVESEYDDHLEDLNPPKDQVDTEDDGGRDFEEEENFGDDEMGDEDFDHEDMDEGEEFDEGGEEHFTDMDGEDNLGLDENEDELDDLLGEEEEGMGDEEGPDIFDGADHHEDEHANMDQAPMMPQSNRANSSRRRNSRPLPEKTGKRVASGNESEVTLDDILNLQDEDIERVASTPLEDGDLDSLLGRKVDRAGNRVATQGYSGYRSAESDRRRALHESIWDTENEPELKGRVAKRPGSQKQNQRRVAGKTPVQPFAPDRRRVTAKRNVNEFDQVFGAPDISKYFD